MKTNKYILALAILVGALCHAHPAAAAGGSAAIIDSVKLTNPYKGIAAIKIEITGTLSSACERATIEGPEISRRGAANYEARYTVKVSDTGVPCEQGTTPFSVQSLSPVLAPGIYAVIVNDRPYGQMVFEPAAVFWSGYEDGENEIAGTPIAIDSEGALPKLGCIFKDRNYPKHNGVDFPVPDGTPVHTVMSGQVVFAGAFKQYGNMVVVENGGRQVRYAHLSEIRVQFGQIVPAGWVVGLSGNTGSSTAPHLHLDVRVIKSGNYGKSVDPMVFLDANNYQKVPCSSKPK